jgi:hypothetical protein
MIDMNAPVAASSIVHFLIGILVLFLIWHFGIRPYLLDRFRSELFDLRDELFDYAADGNIAFEEDRYGTLRMWLNALIRMAHRVTFFDTIVVTQLADVNPKSDPKVEERLERIERMLKGEEGDELQEFALRSLKIAVKYFFLRSPAMWIAFVLLAVYALLRNIMKGLRYTAESTTNAIVERVGKQIEEQVRLRKDVHSGAYR